MMENPRVRTLEAFPVETSRGRMVFLRDPMQINEDPIIVSPTTYFILALMDGKNSTRDIQAAVMRQFGTLIQSSEIEELVERLDEYYLLENERFRSRQAELIEEFRSESVRQARGAGVSYPCESQELAEMLLGFFDERPEPKGKRISGFVAPHIDLQRGRRVYASAYKEAGESEPPVVALILGTAHFGQERLFASTYKDFATPLGTVENSREETRRLADACSFDLFEEEYAHKLEHSIELQTLFVKLLFPEMKIVPVTVGSFGEFIFGGKDPRADERIESFVRGARELVAKGAWVLVSADLSHIGQRFGDDIQLNPLLFSLVEKEDRELLREVEEGDPDGLLEKIASVGDKYRVCGFPPIYIALRVLEGEKGKVVGYELSPEKETQSVVSFGSVVFESSS